MSIETNDVITRQDIIDRFNTRLKDWVGGFVNIFPTTNFTGSHRVWDGTHGWEEHSTHPSHTTAHTVVRTFSRTAGAIAASSTGAGGATNSTLTSETTPTEQMVEEDFSGAIGIDSSVGHVTTVMRNFLKQYSKIHKTNFQNTGNLVPAGWTGLIKTGITKGTTIPAASSAQMDGDIDQWLDTNNLRSGSKLDPNQFINFIDQCRTIWQNRCINGQVLETFKFNYCHNNCHTNVTCYNSRGRR